MFLLPSAVAEAILASQASWGWLSLRHDRVEDLAVVAGYSVKETQRFPMANISTFLREHYSRVIDVVPWSAVWYRAQPDLHTAWLQVIRRGPGVGLPIETVRDWIPTGWRNPGPDRPMPMLTVALIEGRPDWKAWWATSAGVVPAELHLVEEGAALFAPLRPGWPVDLLASLLVTVVGVGSIGSAAADALAAYAIGRLALVDPDRLLLHNLARHRLPREQLGRRKVTAVAEQLRKRFPGLQVESLPLNVVGDANLMRPLFRRSDIVVVCVDGVAPRRVANHLAVWAATPAVLACVLEDGAIGEILRVRPGSGSGCLLCHRAQLRDDGRIDLESGLDLGYGIGLTHRPMTAVGGDLALVGEFAAKVAVATLLEGHGYRDQRLPGEHAVLGLRPVPGLTPPFDVAGAGAVGWSPVDVPRPDCPTCQRQ